MMRTTYRPGRSESRISALLLPMLLSMGAESVAQAIPVRINGEGWTQGGAILHSSDTIEVNYNDNWFQGVRGHITALAEINKNWEGTIGIGVRTIQKALSGREVATGNPESAARLQVGVEPYIAQARFTYTHGDEAASPFRLTFGYFPFNYNPEVKNLGLYLLRGTVYPGYLFSGFELDETIGIANLLGANLNSTWGHFSHDLILSSETKIRPLFDYSLAYIGKYRPNPFFEIGAGANFYRLIPINGDLTTPRDPAVFTEDESVTSNGKYDHRFYYLGTAGGSDTVRFTLKGIKVGAFATLDLKSLTGQGSMGPEDLKIYAEMAVIGVQNYKGIYENIGQRIPVMVGFNLPMFKLLDHLSLEVEYYGAPYRNDYYKLENYYSPIPISNQELGRKVVTDSATGRQVFESGNKSVNRFPMDDPYDAENMHKDDFKWSLHGAKTIKKHIRISGQAANDHFRPGGAFFVDKYESAFTTLKDWYFMMKLSYLF